MVTTSTITSYLTAQSQGSKTTATQASSTTKATSSTRTANSSAAASSATTISSLARQLAISAARVDALGRTLTRSQLADRANSTIKELTAPTTTAQQAAYDAETPRTTDSALLDKAKQATAFMASARSGTGTATNPFAGLSREQLYDVVFDDSGAFTHNERAAALTEVTQQESQWQSKTSADALSEYNSTGKLTKFFSALLDHFNSLPAVQQSIYPENYAATLRTKIAQNTSYRNADPSVLNDLMGNQTATKMSARQSSAATRLAGLKLLQQTKGTDASSPTLPSQTAAGSQNSRNFSAQLKNAYSTAAHGTLFNYFDS